jgi:hypothetical protein
VRLALSALVAAAALAGCGGDDTPGASAAGVVPADVSAYVEAEARLDSGGWRELQALLDRFPDGPNLVEELNEKLGTEGLTWERDVDPALGDVVALVWPRDARELDEAVLLTQSDDVVQLRALVRKVEEVDGEPYVVGEVNGWTAVAESRAAIDDLRSGGGALSESEDFQAALARLPEERVAFGWARGDVVAHKAPKSLEWIAGALEPGDDEAAATLVTRSSQGTTGRAYESRLVDQAPADALAFASFDGATLRGAATPLGDHLDVPVALLDQLRGESALWVRAGGPQFLEVTFVLDVVDPAAARGALEPLLRDVQSDFELDFEFGVVDGKLVATSASSPAAALDARGDRLGNSADFERAVDAAGMPSETGGLLFVDVADVVPLLGLARFAGIDVPAELLENLRPVRSVLAWSEPEGSTTTHRVALQMR